MKQEIWIPSAVGLLAVVATVLIYLAQRGRTRLEYVVITNRPILPGRVADDLEVSHHGAAVSEPVLFVTRLVNAGNQEIRPDDYETDLIVTFEGVQEIVSATWSASRPDDLRPKMQQLSGIVSSGRARHCSSAPPVEDDRDRGGDRRHD